MAEIGILTGPTATGKTAIALEFARAHGGIEIVNADSLLLYRELDIGSAKPTPEERAQTPHHLIDLQDPSEPYDAGDFARDANAAIEAIQKRGKRALVVGGTGFYLKALVFGLWKGPGTDPELRAHFAQKTNAELYDALYERDPVSATRIGANDRYRLVRALEIITLSGKTPTQLQSEMPTKPDPRFRIWIIERESEELNRRIAERTRLMLEAGLIEETRKILAKTPLAPALKSVGYAQVCAYLEGLRPEGRKIRPGQEGLSDEIELATRQLVKRQRTWFRGFARLAETRTFMLNRERGALDEEMRDIYKLVPLSGHRN